MKKYFFKKNDKIGINDILKCINKKKVSKNFIVNDIKELDTAWYKDISFFSSLKYLDSL